MSRELSFKDVCDFIKEEEPQFFGYVDSLLNLLLLFSPLFLGSQLDPKSNQIIASLDLLGIKGELKRIGKNIFKKLTEAKEEDLLSKQKRLEIAYNLIIYTSFFEAIDKVMPEVSKTAKLKSEEKYRLSANAIEQFTKSKRFSDKEKKALFNPQKLEFKLWFPHPVNDFNTHRNQLRGFYQELVKGFISFIQCLAFWEELDDRQKEEILRKISNLTETSIELFSAQYFALATKYNEFYIWANLQEHEETHSKLKKIYENVSLNKDLLDINKSAIDIGFQKLDQSIRSIPREIQNYLANIVIDELGHHYLSRIEETILKTDLRADQSILSLTYPKISDIFIPQSFKAIRYKSDLPLENEAAWKDIPKRDDLGSFILSYLSSPHSTMSPLIILGHPGSGKSLLTKIISARLVNSPYSPVRVELRNINADNEIANQIEEQIVKTLNRKTSWAELSDYFKKRPAVVILDGYDELLQASGKVFAGYPNKVQLFQENEVSLGRAPVRTIITSRITLIDKARIPDGATIIRLLEFDENKRSRWISVWNNYNQQYFQQSKVEQFRLPEKNKKIISLAEQPLLLLMLALYDSENNQLRKSEGLDQTILYDSLLRRFIERESLKSDEFKDLSTEKQNVEIEREMERLGVAAVGMFNRKTLSIKPAQLSSDLGFFKLEKKAQTSEGNTLSQADMLLGSFFFIQESQSIYKQGDNENKDADKAFEFLHNTFGEFLTADFILRKITNETSNVFKLKSIDAKDMLDQRLSDPNGFPDQWFYCLIYTALFTRPVILDMMHEWIKHILKRQEMKEVHFINALDLIVTNQVGRILTSNSFPKMMMSGSNYSLDGIPTTAYIATYSLNLILLRTYLSENDFVFDEDTISLYESSARPWDRLTYLWRSWYSLESLNGLSTVLIASRKDRNVSLKKADSRFRNVATSNKLDSILDVSIALADDITASLAGIALYDTYNRKISISELSHRAKMENIDLEIQLYIKRAREVGHKWFNYREAVEVTKAGIDLFFRHPMRNIEASSDLINEVIRLARLTDTKEEVAETLIRSTRGFDWHPAILKNLLSIAGELEDKHLIEFLLDGIFKYRDSGETILGLHRKDDLFNVELAIELSRIAIKIRNPEINQFIYRIYMKDYLDEIINHSNFDAIPSKLSIYLLKMAEKAKDKDFVQYLYKNLLRGKFELDLRNSGFLLREYNDQVVSMGIEVIGLGLQYEDYDFLKQFLYLFLDSFKRPVEYRRRMLHQDDFYFDFPFPYRRSKNKEVSYFLELMSKLALMFSEPAFLEFVIGYISIRRDNLLPPFFTIDFHKNVIELAEKFNDKPLYERLTDNLQKISSKGT